LKSAGRYHLKATISVDHRVSNGAEAAQFMQALASFLKKSSQNVGVRNANLRVLEELGGFLLCYT
jgi:hypothetical protein